MNKQTNKSFSAAPCLQKISLSLSLSLSLSVIKQAGMLLRNGDAIQGKTTPSPEGIGWDGLCRSSSSSSSWNSSCVFLWQKLLGLAFAGFFFSLLFSS